MYLLKPVKVSDGELELEITFGLSNRAADIDNPLKCFIDVLQKKYNFDDKMIYRLIVNKVITKKGDDFIKFYIKELEQGVVPWTQAAGLGSKPDYLIFTKKGRRNEKLNNIVFNGSIV